MGNYVAVQQIIKQPESMRGQWRIFVIPKETKKVKVNEDSWVLVQV